MTRKKTEFQTPDSPETGQPFPPMTEAVIALLAKYGPMLGRALASTLATEAFVAGLDVEAEAALLRQREVEQALHRAGITPPTNPLLAVPSVTRKPLPRVSARALPRTHVEVPYRPANVSLSSQLRALPGVRAITRSNSVPKGVPKITQEDNFRHAWAAARQAIAEGAAGAPGTPGLRNLMNDQALTDPSQRK